MSMLQRKAPPIEETIKMAQAAALFAKGFSTVPSLLRKQPTERVATHG